MFASTCQHITKRISQESDSETRNILFTAPVVGRKNTYFYENVEANSSPTVVQTLRGNPGHATRQQEDWQLFIWMESIGRERR